MAHDPIFSRLGRGRKKVALPVLPFGGSSGYMGSDASKERAGREDETGVTEWRQHQVMQLLEQAGPLGMTYQEIGARMDWHHGQSTGTLSPMHGVGLVSALATTRDGCTVYVLPKFVGERATREYGGGKGEAMRAALEAAQSELGTLKRYVETLEQDVAEANGRADEAGNRLLPLAQEADELRARVARLNDLCELHEQTIAAKEVTIRALGDENAALRLHRFFTGLEPQERELATALLQRLSEVEDRPDDSAVGIRISSLRTVAGVLRRLMAAPGAEQPVVDEGP